MKKVSNVTCILLAAGSSKRFGSNKLVHRLPTGLSLLETSLAIYSQVFSNTSVVLNPASPSFEEQHETIIALGASYIASPMADRGLSESLVAGIASSQNKSTTNIGWLIALADMPYVQSDTLYKLAQALKSDNIVLPMSSRGVGNPVGFGVKFKAQLCAVEGDVGAKSVVMANPKALVNVEVEDLGIHRDIDKPADVRVN